MALSIKTKKLHIGGMTCVGCQKKIEKRLRNTAGIQNAEVSYRHGTATITYDADIISLENITIVIERLGYIVPTGDNRKESSISRMIGILIIIVSLYVLLERFGILNMLTPSRLADAKMSYGMLFVIGLVTSVHCIAMCGGINLSQSILCKNDNGESLLSTSKPTFLYNLGRVISYTSVGFIVGMLGSVITFTNLLQGVLKLIAGIFMVIMGINMLGMIPWLYRLNPRMPKIFARGIEKGKRSTQKPLIIGLLNGLMPCGPLQAMQIYALSTGNPLTGALSMFLFGIGTVPLMFGFGAIISVLGKKFAGKVMTIGAILVVVLGLSMFSQGWILSEGFADLLPNSGTTQNNTSEISGKVNIENDIQTISSTLTSYKYPDITVKAGIPVKWIIDAPKGSVNGCNNRIFINEYGIEYTFEEGENVIEFTPTAIGEFQYSCWMGMIRATITVVD